MPPEDVREDTDEFIDYIDEHGADELAEYLRMLKEDYYNGELTEATRVYTIEDVPPTGVDISTLVDLCVTFGWAWEREDPAPPPEQSEETSDGVDEQADE